eukprot:TRINITY_DN26477_c0_g1_i1.p1 TRINITY_DN26477_c0_g1~~TRINITY_DN26477_c0_g1_i1.p1  ORF type:complete len:158 (+),score=9.67 TRINITY_DN26477_c0_g1_i1:85-558(+)
MNVAPARSDAASRLDGPPPDSKHQPLQVLGDTGTVLHQPPLSDTLRQSLETLRGAVTCLQQAGQLLAKPAFLTVSPLQVFAEIDTLLDPASVRSGVPTIHAPGALPDVKHTSAAPVALPHVASFAAEPQQGAHETLRPSPPGAASLAVSVPAQEGSR